MKRYLSYLTLLSLILLFTCDNSKSDQGEAGNKDSTATSEPVEEKRDAVECMQFIIAADDSLGSIRNHACEEIPLSQTINDYVAGLGSLDYGGCPEDFRQAFHNHLTAWGEMETFTEQFSDLRGEMHDVFDEIEAGEEKDTFKPLLDAIWSTWAEVETAMNENGIPTAPPDTTAGEG